MGSGFIVEVRPPLKSFYVYRLIGRFGMRAPLVEARDGLRALVFPSRIQEVLETVRADKWLWATRFYKTRAAAGEFLREGKVRRNGHVMKRSSSVQVGDFLEIPFVSGPGVRLVVVKSVIAKRVGAPEARACYEDRTDPVVYEDLKRWQIARQEAARGRPTKKDRRAIDQIKESWEWGL